MQKFTKILHYNEQFIGLDGSNVCNNVSEDVNAAEEHGLVEELIVVVEEDGSVVHGREPNGRNSHLGEFFNYVTYHNYLTGLVQLLDLTQLLEAPPQLLK